MTKGASIQKFLAISTKKKAVPNVSKGKPFGYGKAGKYNA